MLYRSRPKKVFYYGKAVGFRKQAMGLAFPKQTLDTILKR